MNIKIKNKRGFAACMAATTKDDSRTNLRGVRIETDGTVVGTTGHIMVLCRDCVEPFEGDAVTIQTPVFNQAQMNAEQDATIIMDGDEGHVRLYVKKKRQILIADKIAGSFPSWRELDSTIDPKGTTDAQLSFNVKYVYDIAKIACVELDVVRFVMTSSLAPVHVFFHKEREDIKMILMPVRN